LIELKGVSKIYDSGPEKVGALDNVDLKVERGEIRGIIGFSGAGKSTLLRCINLLEKPTEGKVLFKGEDLTILKNKELRKRRMKMGMIFQHFNIMPSRNVYKNIAYPLRKLKLSKEEEKSRVDRLLKLTGLEDKRNFYPSQLSGGQKQRVAIARALANEPDVLLCDEATSALDPKTTKAILTLLKDLRDELGLTIILITHEMSVVREICDKVTVLEAGKVVEEGRVSNVFSAPKQEITKEFLETTNSDNSGTLLNFNGKREDIKIAMEYFKSKNLAIEIVN
jgi:D-methionine transport system ATP-binding protein